MLMSKRPAAGAGQSGSLIIEALVALVVFSFGILAMMSVMRVSVSAQTDATLRADAAQYANELAQTIWIGIDRSARSDETSFITSLQRFQYQPEGTQCAFSGDTSSASNSDLPVAAWLARVRGTTDTARGLPGASQEGYQQVKIETSPADSSSGGTAGRNQVTITLCWKSPTDEVPRKHTLVTQVN